MRRNTRVERPHPNKEPSQGQHEAAFLSMVEGEQQDEKKAEPKKQAKNVHASFRSMPEQPHDENKQQHKLSRVGAAQKEMHAMWKEKMGGPSVNRLAKKAQKFENKGKTLNEKKYLKHYSQQELRSMRKIGDRYYVLDKIGGGGMGSVERVLDSELDMVMVAKSVLPEKAARADIMSRVRTEVTALAQLSEAPYNSPWLVKTYGIEENNGAPVIIMEYVQSPDLGKRLVLEGRLPEKMTASIAIQTCRALAAVHGRGIIHRDLKPANIFLTEARNDDVHVRVGDFGIAKVNDEPLIPRGRNSLQQIADRRVTEPGTAMGTPEYMSPEQVRGHRLDKRSDLYSLGIILYNCISGKTPFEHHANVEDVLVANRDEKPKPIKNFRENEDRKNPLEDIVMKLLEKKPRNRFQNAVEVIDAIIDAMVEEYPELAQHEDYQWRLDQRKVEDRLYSRDKQKEAKA